MRDRVRYVVVQKKPGFSFTRVIFGVLIGAALIVGFILWRQDQHRETHFEGTVQVKPAR